MAMFTLHEFIVEHCDNNLSELQKNSAILIQAIAQDRLISRYSELLKNNISMVQAYLQNFDIIPGVTIQENLGHELDGKNVFLHILITLLSNPRELSDNHQVLPQSIKLSESNEKLPDSSQQIAIFSESGITSSALILSIGTGMPNISAHIVNYYSNLYHLILYWILFLDNGFTVEKKYEFYYDYLIREGTVVYKVYQIVKDVAIMLSVNYLSEHNIYIDWTGPRINHDYIKNVLPLYTIKQDILVRRKFYNFHSHIPYIIYTKYNENYKNLDNNVDYARANYLTKLQWIQRRAGIAHNYQIINRTDLTVAQTNSQNKKRPQVLVKKILLAQAGELVVDGPVLGLWHVAKYGVSNKQVQLLIESAEKIGLNSNYMERSLYSVLLLIMGFDLYRISSLLVQQMWATILTGIMPAWPGSNLSYKNNNKLVGRIFGLGFTTFAHSIESYYFNSYVGAVLSKESLINMFNIPAYSNPYLDDRHLNIILYRYSFIEHMIRNQLYGLYPVLSDKRIMQNWLLDKDSELHKYTFNNLYYIDLTLSTAELAAKYDIANIYSRQLLFVIIKARKERDELLYYRKPGYQIGDKRVSNGNMQESIIDEQDAYTSIYKSADDIALVNFITYVHALDMFNRTGKKIFHDEELWTYLIDNKDYEE